MAESGTIKIQLAVKLRRSGQIYLFSACIIVFSICNKNVSKTALQFILQHTYTVRDARHPAFRSCRHRFMCLSEIDKMGNITRGRYSRKRRKQGDSRGVHNWTFLASQMTPWVFLPFTPYPLTLIFQPPILSINVRMPTVRSRCTYPHVINNRWTE